MAISTEERRPAKGGRDPKKEMHPLRKLPGYSPKERSLNPGGGPALSNFEKGRLKGKLGPRRGHKKKGEKRWNRKNRKNQGLLKKEKRDKTINLFEGAEEKAQDGSEKKEKKGGAFVFLPRRKKRSGEAQ